MTQDKAQSLRDIILLQADFLNDLAAILTLHANGGASRIVLAKQVRSAAGQLRARATLLNDVLAETEPKAEAS